jgi:hypothetical protein
MTSTIRYLAAASLLFISGKAAIAYDPNGSAPSAWTFDHAQAVRELEAGANIIEHPGDKVGCRGVFRFALEAAALHWDPEKVNEALKLGRSMQDLDPNSPTYGNFRWRLDQSKVEDPNGVEFCTAIAALLRLKYSDGLDDTGKALLDQILTTALEGVHRHVVKVEYTNIWVLKTWNLIALGAVLNKPEVTQEGYTQMRTWMTELSKAGIGEYNATNYYGADMDALGLICKNAPDPSIRAMAETGLHFMWALTAANWWAPGGRLSGANARDYDYLYGRGYTETHTWLAGWLRTPPQIEGAGWLDLQSRNNLVTYYRDCNFNPPPEWTDDIRNQIPRTVVERWGHQRYESAVDYIGQYFSLGSSGASKAREDRTLVANLGDSPSVPELMLFMDGRGDPYGANKVAQAQGAMKSLHLTPFIATVQHGPEVLQLLSYPPLTGAGKDSPDCLLTQLTIPAGADIWVDGKLVQPGPANAPVTLPNDKLIAIHMGNAALAVRFLCATTPDGGVAPIQYVLDGPDNVAKRITVVHSAGAPAAGRATAAVWVYGEDGIDDDQLAGWYEKCSAVPFTAGVNNGVASLEVKSEHGPLRIEANVDTGVRTVLSGGEPDGLFTINGRDYGHPILSAQ